MPTIIFLVVTLLLLTILCAVLICTTLYYSKADSRTDAATSWEYFPTKSDTILHPIGSGFPQYQGFYPHIMETAV